MRIALIGFGTLAGGALAEVFVRVAGIQAADDPFLRLGRVVPFVERDVINGVPSYRVAHREVYRERNTVFPVEKPSGAFRVLCFGSSAAAGWPHPPTEIYTAYLHTALQRAYPERHIEVVNLGAHAYAAYRSRLILNEAIKFNPDLVVIYAGNNEFIERRRYRTRARWYDPLRRVAERSVLYRLAAGNHWLFPDDTLDAGVRGHVAFEQWSKIERVVLNLRKDPEQFEQVRKHYAFSIGSMIEQAGRRDVPVLLLTVPVNLKDWRPNVSLHSAPEEHRREWQNLFATGRAAVEDGLAAEGEVQLRRAAALDPQHAARVFFSGAARKRRVGWPTRITATARPAILTITRSARSRRSTKR